jgi:hypothetical protein
MLIELKREKMLEKSGFPGWDLKQKMKTKKIYLIITMVVGLLTLGIVCLGLSGRKTLQAESQKPQESTQTTTSTELKDYYSLYKDPYVVQIRTTLNSYLKDPKTLSETVLEGLGDSKSGLNNFSSDYYKGRFVVMDIKDSAVGGEEINILFPDKPDKVFWTWVYKLAEDGGYEMRGFAESPYYTQEKLDYFLKEYPQLMQDRVHSL